MESSNIRLVAPPKPKWGAKKFNFKGLFKCASCQSTIIAEEKFRKRKWDKPRHHIYYHCTRWNDENCQEPYISEDILTRELIRYIQFMEMAHPQVIKISDKLKRFMQDYGKIRDEILLEQNVDPDYKPMTFLEFAKYSLYRAPVQEKRETLMALGKQLYISNRSIVSSPLNN